MWTVYPSSSQVGFTDNKFFVQLEEKGEYNSKQGGFVLSDNIFKGNDGSVLLYSAKPFDGRLLLVGGGDILSGKTLVSGLSYNSISSVLSYYLANGDTRYINLYIDQKLDKSAVKGYGGTSATDVMSQKVVTSMLNSKLSRPSAAPDSESFVAIKANSDGVTTTVRYIPVSTTLDKPNVVQTTGDSETDVMSQKAVTDNFARLVDGKVPASQLPSYVDDVLEYDNKNAFPAEGEEGKIYVDKSTNLTYRWSGSMYIMIGGGDLNIENGTGTGSLVQKRLRSDGVTWTTAKAYQGASTALGEGTQAGRTEEEFNAYFWDSVNNVPLHGGKGKNSLGEILDHVGLTYTKSYSSAFAANENNKAIPKDSAVFGRYNTAYNLGEFVCGNYTDNNRNPNTVFAVGTGIDDSRRSTGFEVRTDGYCYSYNKVIATEDYVNNTAVRKEGTPYVVYISEANGKSTVMPYRFQKQSIVDAEYKVMFQPMLDGRLYTRYPTDEYHAANKGYVDSKTSLYKHRIHAANAIFDLIVINNSSAKITKFTDLVGANYISMYVGSPACTPAVEVGIISSGSPNYDTIGIRVGWYIDNLNRTDYLNSNLESDTVIEL